jgi:hypothetical protein
MTFHHWGISLVGSELWKIRIQSVKLLNRARQLARSGGHADHRTIFAQLEMMDGFADARARLGDFRSQLDRICALAQSRRRPVAIPRRASNPT